MIYIIIIIFVCFFDYYYSLSFLLFYILFYLLSVCLLFILFHRQPNLHPSASSAINPCNLFFHRSTSAIHSRNFLLHQPTSAINLYPPSSFRSFFDPATLFNTTSLHQPNFCSCTISSSANQHHQFLRLPHSSHQPTSAINPCSFLPINQHHQFLRLSHSSPSTDQRHQALLIPSNQPTSAINPCDFLIPPSTDQRHQSLNLPPSPVSFNPATSSPINQPAPSIPATSSPIDQPVPPILATSSLLHQPTNYLASRPHCGVYNWWERRPIRKGRG